MLYYSYVIELNKFRYNYGRGANKTFKSILVPNYEEIPDFVKNCVAEPTFEKGIKDKNLSIEIEKWQWFELGSLFEIKKGKRLTKADMEEGPFPYIGAIDSNNGVSAYISNDEHLHDGNTISVSYNGSIAEAFYQKEPFWATDDVNVLYSPHINSYIALFVATIIHREKYRFNYGRKWDLDLMKKSKIKLPAIKTGKPIYEPDWQFMEDYIKSLPYSACL